MLRGKKFVCWIREIKWIFGLKVFKRIENCLSNKKQIFLHNYYKSYLKNIHPCLKNLYSPEECQRIKFKSYILFQYLNFLSWNISIRTSSFCKSSKTPSLDLAKKKKLNSTPAPKKQVSVKTVLTSLGLTEKGMFELLYSDNQKTMEYEDILAKLKCLWCCYKANSFNRHLLKH